MKPIEILKARYYILKDEIERQKIEMSRNPNQHSDSFLGEFSKELPILEEAIKVLENHKFKNK
jgi:DNA-directed RNA polymerase beta' subunit